MSKEFYIRICGIVVLLILVITIVPLILNGNKHYDYGGSQLTMPVVETIVVDAESSMPSEQAGTDILSEGKSDFSQNTVVDLMEGATDLDTAISVHSPVWALHVATFVSRDAIIKLRDRLRLAGYRSYVRKVYSKSSKMAAYKAYVGPSFRRENLELQMQALQGKKLQPEIVNFIEDIEQAI